MVSIVFTQVATLMTPTKAEALAAQLNAEAFEFDEPEYFVAVHDPKGTGQSFVEYRDAAGVVGRL